MNKLLSILGLSTLLLFANCGDDDVPPAENDEEVIDRVTLTFTPTGGTPLEFVAVDPDGEGVNGFDIPTIALDENTVYILTMSLENTATLEDITEEIQEEATAHQFFFSWTGSLFESPTGLGNYADDGAGVGPYGADGGNVNYDDNETDYQTEADEDGVSPRADFPVGLQTIWETGAASTVQESFRVVLKHQPGQKVLGVSSNIGSTDLDLTFPLEVQ